MDWSVWPLSLAVIIGLVMFLRGFKVYREYRVVEDTPQIAIRSIPMGLARVKGKATGDQRVYSPVTHTPCYYYVLRMEHGKHASHASSRARFGVDVGGVKFYLDDGTGKVSIDARTAELDVAKTWERHVSAAKSQGSLADAMAQKVLGGTEVSGGDAPESLAQATDEELRYYVSRAAAKAVFTLSERVWEAGGLNAIRGDREKLQHIFERPLLGEQPSEEKMAAFLSGLQARGAGATLDPRRGPRPDGWEDPEPGPGKASAEQSAVTARLMSHPELALAPERSAFTLTEFCVVPGREYDVIGTCVENPGAKDEHDRNLIVRGSHEATYVISDKERAGVEQGLQQRALAKVAIGSALTVASVAILLVRLGLF